MSRMPSALLAWTVVVLLASLILIWPAIGDPAKEFWIFVVIWTIVVIWLVGLVVTAALVMWRERRRRQA